MRLCFNIKLPDRGFFRVGSKDVEGLTPVDWGALYVPGINKVPDLQLVSGLGSGLEIEGRSYRGYEGRELNRFFPVVLCLETLTRINEWHFETGGNGHLPPLYKSGVVYQEEPPGEEEWLDYPSLLDQMWGDCEDLAGVRTAELRHHVGEPAVCAIKFKDFEVNGQVVTLIHVVTLRADGQVEDPSKVLGMRGAYDNRR